MHPDTTLCTQASLYVPRLLAAGMARIAHKAELTHVVLASVDAEVAAWLRPCWLLTLDAAGVPTLRRSPQRAPAAARRPSAGVNIRYDEDNYDSGDATPAVDPVRARVCRLCNPMLVLNLYDVLCRCSRARAVTAPPSLAARC